MISETAILSKLTRRLIPFMFLLYIVSYLDRINVGFAALQLNKALNFDPAVFGLGAGLFFIGYFVFEVPSNLIMERVGARVMVAASIQPLAVREAGSIKTLSAGLTVFRIGSDGKLTFVRKYDVDVGNKTQFWSGMVTLS